MSIPSNYAIIGSGAIGSALARRFAAHGVPAQIANTRGPGSLQPLAVELGGGLQPVELAEALRADVIILAVPFAAVADAVAGAADWNGRIVVDATNAINFTDFSPADLGGRLSSHIVAEQVPGAALVKAFNTLPAAILAQEPRHSAGRRTLFISSDYPEAAGTLAVLADRLGFAPVFLGEIAKGGALQQFGGPLIGHSFLMQA
jgi:predicted dinucleotide-binding enzyme